MPQDRVIALLPAHNESDHLPNALRSLFAQTHLFDRIIVVSDNSTDDTVAIARSWPMVECMESVNNQHMKAGALNQAIASLAAEPDDTWLFVMDADSAIVPEFIGAALVAGNRPGVGAVGGIFVGDGKNGLLGDLQHLEYSRYEREIGRRKGEAKCLTGTSTMIRLGVMREIREARASGELPGSDYYDTHVLTEDFELTIAVRRLGYLTVSPKSCKVITETMPTLRQLWNQRKRWQLGALQVIRMHGIHNRTIRPYVRQQTETYIGLIACAAIWFTMLGTIAGSFDIQPVWLVAGAIFQTERVVSSWRAGWKGRVYAATMIFDTAFDLIIGAVYVACLWYSITGKTITWGGSIRTAQ